MPLGITQLKGKIISIDLAAAVIIVEQVFDFLWAMRQDFCPGLTGAQIHRGQKLGKQHLFGVEEFVDFVACSHIGQPGAGQPQQRQAQCQQGQQATVDGTVQPGDQASEHGAGFQQDKTARGLDDASPAGRVASLAH